jgi:hypothetical protein
MSEWSSLQFGKVKLNNSTFDVKVGGGKFLDVGVHENLTISEVEPKVSAAGNTYLWVRFENEEGAGIKARVMINGKPDDNGDARFHWEYTNLSNALASSDLETALKFFGETIPSKPELLAALVGLKASIKIVHGDNGYIVKDCPNGKMLIDIETDQPFDGTEVYADYTACKEAADELGLQRCWNQVNRVFAGSEESQVKNVEVIKGLMAPKKKAEKKKPVSL